MCFFCAEGTATVIAQTLASGKRVYPSIVGKAFFPTFHVLESHNPFPAIKKVQRSLAQPIVNLDNFESWNNAALSLAVICRVCDILVKEGFASPNYQALIKNVHVFKLIRSFFSFSPSLDQRLLTKESSFAEGFQENIFFREEGQKFIESNVLKKDSRLLLQNYINWWYNHEDYKGNDDKSELDTFAKIFPFVFLSFATIRRFSPTDRLIAQLVNTNLQIPFGLNLDMWLQRMAARHLIQTKGIEALLPYEKKCRPAILYYLLVSKQLTEKAKMRLREAVLESGKFKADKPFLRSAQKRRLFYMNTEQFIMLELQKSNLSEYNSPNS